MLSLKIIGTSIRGVSSQLLVPAGTTITTSKTSPTFYSSQQLNNPKSFSTCQALNKHYPIDYKVKKALALSEVDLPEKPKKPPSIWLAFVKDRKDEILRNNLGMTAAGLAKILSQEYKHIDKTDYEKDYQNQLEIYRQKLQEYHDSLTDAQKQYLNLIKAYRQEEKALQVIRYSKPPKKPRSLSNMFVSSRCQEASVKERLKQVKSAEVFSELFKEYRLLSDEEKQKYVALQQEDKKRFGKELNEWYDSIKNDENSTKAVIEHATMIYSRYKALNYV